MSLEERKQMNQTILDASSNVSERGSLVQLQNIDKYLQATGDHLGVESERYGGGYRAITAHRSSVYFFFDKLEGDDLEGTQAQQFFAENPLFPAAAGATPYQAMQNLDKKLGILYRFEPSNGPVKWKAIPLFELTAEHDCDSDEEQSYYDVRWSDIVSDLHSPDTYFYEASKAEASTRNKRDLFALINFNYKGPFLNL